MKLNLFVAVSLLSSALSVAALRAEDFSSAAVILLPRSFDGSAQFDAELDLFRRVLRARSGGGSKKTVDDAIKKVKEKGSSSGVSMQDALDQARKDYNAHIQDALDKTPTGTVKPLDKNAPPHRQEHHESSGGKAGFSGRHGG